jgi:hypothetical protein
VLLWTAVLQHLILLVLLVNTPFPVNLHHELFLCCVLQASTNTLLAHFLSVVFANCIIGVVSKARGRPAAA